MRIRVTGVAVGMGTTIVGSVVGLGVIITMAVIGSAFPQPTRNETNSTTMHAFLICIFCFPLFLYLSICICSQEHRVS